MNLDASVIIDASVNTFAQVLRFCPNLDKLIVLNFMFDKNAFKLLRKEQCSANHLSLECIGIDRSWQGLFKLWPKVTALTINRCYQPQLSLQLAEGIEHLQELHLVNCAIDSSLFRSLQKRNTLRKLSLIETNQLKGNRYQNIAKLLPQLEQIQVSINDEQDLASLTGKNIKYLQLLGDTVDDTIPVHSWKLRGLLELEELDLVEIDSSKCRVATYVPTIRVLSIQHSDILNTNNDLSETIAKLPKLQTLRLRKTIFPAEELLHLIETDGPLTEIVLDLPSKLQTTKLLKSLLDRGNAKNSYEAPRSSFQMLIVVEFADVSILQLKKVTKI